MSASEPAAVRLRQAVLAATDLDAVAARIREALDIGEPFADPGVEYFGLRNAVFALGDTFLEVVSPLRSGTSAGRLLERRGGDCGYMLMFQVPDLAAARERARAAGIRAVFEVAVDDMAEVHLHPADMRGAIVSLSQPIPPGAWRWGGPDWPQRTVAHVSVAGATVAVTGAAKVAERWTSILGAPPPGINFVEDPDDRGLTEIRVAGAQADSGVLPPPLAPDAER
ncbi:MAG: VOC family protein [Solirubrobacteraceae bacterium]